MNASERLGTNVNTVEAILGYVASALEEALEKGFPVLIKHSAFEGGERLVGSAQELKQIAIQFDKELDSAYQGLSEDKLYLEFRGTHDKIYHDRKEQLRRLIEAIE